MIAITMGTRGQSPAWSSTAQVLTTLLPHLPIAERLPEYRVWEIWSDVVGPEMARQAHPAKIRAGKLFVTVSHPAWMQELQFTKARIRAALNQRLGSAVVKDLFFFLGQVQASDLQSPPAPERILLPFDDVAVPSCGNPKVEAALTALLNARRRRVAQQKTHG